MPKITPTRADKDRDNRVNGSYLPRREVIVIDSSLNDSVNYTNDVPETRDLQRESSLDRTPSPIFPIPEVGAYPLLSTPLPDLSLPSGGGEIPSDDDDPHLPHPRVEAEGMGVGLDEVSLQEVRRLNTLFNSWEEDNRTAEPMEMQAFSRIIRDASSEKLLMYKAILDKQLYERGEDKIVAIRGKKDRTFINDPNYIPAELRWLDTPLEVSIYQKVRLLYVLKLQFIDKVEDWKWDELVEWMHGHLHGINRTSDYDNIMTKRDEYMKKFNMGSVEFSELALMLSKGEMYNFIYEFDKKFGEVCLTQTARILHNKGITMSNIKLCKFKLPLGRSYRTAFTTDDKWQSLFITDCGGIPLSFRVVEVDGRRWDDSTPDLYGFDQGLQPHIDDSDSQNSDSDSQNSESSDSSDDLEFSGSKS